MSDTCCICKRDFADCPHTVMDVEAWRKKQEFAKQLKEVGSNRMKRIRLLLSPFKNDEPITKEVLLAVLEEL